MRVAAVAAWLAPVLLTQEPTMFETGSVAIGDVTYPYRLLPPFGERPAAGWPVVVFLHGAGERGTDNERQLTWLARPMAQSPLRERFPCLLLAVQCPQGAMWVERPWADRRSTPMAAAAAPALQAVQKALATLLTRPDVDQDRVYLTGLSMGGYGSWELAMRMPETFAAVLPVCGGGDEREAWRLLALPIWAWHGAADKVVPPERSRHLVERLRLLGSEVRYDELAGVGHDSWKQAYGAEGALAWLFAQRRSRPRPATQIGLRGWSTDPVAVLPAAIGPPTIGADGELGDLAAAAAQVWQGALGATAPAAGSGEPSITLRLEPESPHPWRVDVGDRIAISGHDRRAIADGLAMVLGAMAAGELGRRQHRGSSARHPGFVLSLQGSAANATAAPAIARYSWLCGIRWIELPADVDAAAWRQAAGVFGIEVVPSGTAIHGHEWESPDALRWSGDPQRLPSLSALSQWHRSPNKLIRIQVDLDPVVLPSTLPARLLVVTCGVPLEHVPAFGRLFWPQ
ncbi:MAG: dienelactone hydrolase family protein [Planctomycetes bacterium]|nr:dienelactone hydrolase family protein [Planctomycetota bacterium]